MLKSGSQNWGLNIPCESENHVNIGPTLAVTTFSACIDSSAWRIYSERLVHKIIITIYRQTNQLTMLSVRNN